MNLTAIDFFGKVVWTGGSDQERAERLRAYEATGMEPEEIAENIRLLLIYSSPDNCPY